MPADTEVRAGTGSGSISVEDIAAPVSVSSGSGSLTLENIGGPVKASAGSGSIRAAGVAGEFAGSTGSGSLTAWVRLPSLSPGTDTTVLQGEPAVQTTAPASDRTEEAVAQADRPEPDPSRELAPDFTLALADGSTFVLSEEARPVFMVFWAEW